MIVVDAATETTMRYGMIRAILADAALFSARGLNRLGLFIELQRRLLNAHYRYAGYSERTVAHRFERAVDKALDEFLAELRTRK